MRKKNTENIKDILSEYLGENTILRQRLAENRVLKAWQEALGNGVVSYTTNLYFRNGILYVQLSSSILRSELILAKEKLISTLNIHAGMDVVKDIIFR